MVMQAPAQVAPATAMQAAPATVMMPQAATVPQAALIPAAIPQIASMIQTVSPPRARLAVTLDTIRIPFPILRFTAVPGPSEVTTTTQYAPAVQAPQAAFVQQAVAPQAAFVQAPQAAFVQAPQAAFVQAPQAAVVQAQPATIAVQQAPAPATVLVQQAPQPAQAARVACPPVTKETLDMLQAELDKARSQLSGQR
jgi:hypothetical protein